MPNNSARLPPCESASPLPTRPARTIPSRRFFTAGSAVGPVLLGAAFLLAGLAACTTSRATRERFLERVPPPQALLTGTATYGGGVLAVQSWLGPSVRLKKPAEAEEPEGHRAGGRRDRMYDAPLPGEMGGNDSMADPFQDSAGRDDQYSEQEINEMYGRINYQYILPPRLALTFTFANTGTQPMIVSVVDVTSALGNFAPRPEQLTLRPGQQASLDPMLSTLDNNFDQLDVTLAVKIGDRRETQVLRLRRLEEPHPAAPAK